MATTGPASKIVTQPWLPAALVAVGVAPLFYWHLIGLLNRPHYEFLYLLPVAFWLLILALDDMSPLPVSGNEVITGSVVMAAGAALLGFATKVWSPWIATAALLVALPGAVLSAGGWRRLKQWFPAWVFLWILLPLPFGMDEDLIVGLRDVTTSLSSAVIDRLGILHDRSANVIELPGKSLFIADACSGIHSLYVLLAAALLLVSLFRRGIVHAILLLASTFCLVLLENVARIVAVAVLWQRGYDFSEGLKHELLGVILFGTSLLLVLSFDQLWMFFCSTRKFSILNWTYEKISGDSTKHAERFANRRAAGRTAVAGIVVAGLFPLLAMAQLIAMPDSPPKLVDSTYDDFVLPGIAKGSLPDELDGFTQIAYNEIARVPGDPLGQASRQWEFRSPDRKASVLISVDYPYSGVHDLCVCYDNIGWEIYEKHILDPDEARERFGSLSSGPMAVGQLNRSLYGHGMLVFQLDDSTGKTDAVIKELARGNAAERAAGRFKSADAASASTGNTRQGPYIQYQMFVRTAEPVAKGAQKPYFHLFLKASKILREQIASEGSRSSKDAQQQRQQQGERQ